MNLTPPPGPLTGWTVICLRPSMQQAVAHRTIRAAGAAPLSLPGLRLVALPADSTLEPALACPTVVFTSPAAVAFAARGRPLVLGPEARAVAVGEGTARALARRHIRAIVPPDDAMHSDGVLRLSHWQGARGPVGLVTAPGGRGIIAAGLAARGFQLRRAEVYQRLPPRLDRRHHAAVLHSPAPRATLISSGEALAAVMVRLPASAAAVLRESVAVCSSPRLAKLANDHHFRTVLTASAPTTRALLAELGRHVARTGFR